MQVEMMIKRWLNSIDMRESSVTYGVCDSDFWAWKVKDFANGTEQAGIFSFLLFNEAERSFTTSEVQNVLRAVLLGTLKIQRGNGSFEEAYPYESSFCVTGLVQFYLLASYSKYKSLFDEDCQRLIYKICKKSNQYLSHTNEKHGVISNHLMTSYCAIQLYHLVIMKSDSIYFKFKELLDSIHDEGWFEEYGGADPGYQTLLNSYLYLFDILTKGKYKECNKVLTKSLNFVVNFTFPNGEFGGEYGSRGTSVLYPMGLFCLNGIENFEKTWSESTMVNFPLLVSDGNFVPVLNSWVSYHYLCEKKIKAYEELTEKKLFRDSGLLVLSKGNEKFVISLRNGCYRHYKMSRDESVVSFQKNSLFTQLGTAKVVSLQEEFLSLNLGAAKVNQEMNSWFRACVLRILSILIYSFPFAQNIIKKFLAKFVMGSDRNMLTNISLNVCWRDGIKVSFDNVENWKKIKSGYFTHMASSNYSMGNVR